MNEIKAEDTLLAFYQKLISLRKNDVVIRSPDTIRLYEQTGNAWVAKYTNGNLSRWVILNMDATKSTTFVTPMILRGAFLNLLNQELITNDSELSLKAGELLVLSNYE